MTRTLTPRREPLTELGAAGLVAGAGGAPTDGGVRETVLPTCPTTGHHPAVTPVRI